jgi:hypothetical protein
MSPLPIGIDPAEPVEGESQTSGSGGMAFKADTINVSMVKSISFFIRFWIREYVGITREDGDYAGKNHGQRGKLSCHRDMQPLSQPEFPCFFPPKMFRRFTNRGIPDMKKSPILVLPLLPVMVVQQSVCKSGSA